MRNPSNGAILLIAVALSGFHPPMSHAAGDLTSAPLELSTPTAAVPPLSSMLEASGIIVNGYVDGTYEYLSSTGEFKSGSMSRVFDFRPDTFTVHQAALAVAMQPKEGFGGVVNITAGTDAEVIKSYPNTGGSEFDLTQAFAQYAHGPLTVLAGKFVTLAGVELINETQDTNLSRSILFGYAIPFTHTGVRATYVPGELIGLTFGLNNGWDQITDANNGKTAELGLTFTPSKTFSTVVSAYAGKEPVESATRLVNTERDLVDLIVTWSPTDKTTFVANYDWARQQQAAGDGRTARWDGVAGYCNHQFTKTWRASLRLERFSDADGYRTGVNAPQPALPTTSRGQVWTEATLTAGYEPSKHMEVLVEARADKSSVPDAFVVAGDPATAGARLSGRQYSGAFLAIFKF